MELSDGDDESDSQEVHISSSSSKKEETNITTQYPSTQISSQITSESVSYNHPHLYQSYYQNYQQMLQGNATTGNILIFTTNR